MQEVVTKCKGEHVLFLVLKTFQIPNDPEIEFGPQMRPPLEMAEGPSLSVPMLLCHPLCLPTRECSPFPEYTKIFQRPLLLGQKSVLLPRPTWLFHLGNFYLTFKWHSDGISLKWRPPFSVLSQVELIVPSSKSPQHFVGSVAALSLLKLTSLSFSVVCGLPAPTWTTAFPKTRTMCRSYVDTDISIEWIPYYTVAYHDLTKSTWNLSQVPSSGFKS